MITKTQEVQRELQLMRRRREELVKAYEEARRQFEGQLKDLDNEIAVALRGLEAAQDGTELPGENWNVEHEGVVVRTEGAGKIYEG